MRFRLLLITLMAVPFGVVAQEQHHGNIVFYNKGKMYVGVSTDLVAKEAVSDTIAYVKKDVRMFVGGSMKVVEDAAIKQRGGAALTGDFVIGDNVTGPVFVNNLLADAVAGGDTYQTAKGANLFRNNALYFINDTLTVDGTVSGAKNTELIHAAGVNNALKKIDHPTAMALKQYIRRETPMTTADKDSKVIEFPNIIVGDRDKENAQSYVIVEKDIAMTVPYVVVEPGSMFSVETKPVDEVGNTGWTPGQSSSTFPSMMTAHIKWGHQGLPYDNEVEGLRKILGDSYVAGGYGVARKIDITNEKPKDWNWSYAEHFLEFYDPEHPENNKRAGTDKDGGAKSLNYLYPFAPLMSNLRSDHLYFNVLYHPAKGDVTVFGDPIVDPSVVVDGVAYIGIDVTDLDYELIESLPHNTGVKREDRAVGRHHYSRKFVKARSEFDRFNSTPAYTKTLESVADLIKDYNGPNPYIAEVINSKGKNDSYDFVMDNSNFYDGFRLIGNRSFLPLDLSCITTTDVGKQILRGQISMYKSATPSDSVPATLGFGTAANNVHLRNKFWIPYNSVIYAEKNDGSGSMGGAITPGIVYYYLDYFEAAPAGGTATLTGEDFLLAPMQLALVQIGTAAMPYDRISLKSSLFRHGNAKTIKSAEQTNARHDELLLQVINNTTGKEDRTTVVLRENAKLDATDTYDSQKASGGNTTKVGVGASEFTKASASNLQAMTEGAIYTKASTGEQMTTNVIPATTSMLPLYVVPPVVASTEFTITPYRLETMKTVNEVWLEDKHTNVFTLLTPETKYTFQADPLTGDEAAKNRFVLHFGKLAKDEPTIVDSNADISCYYNSSILYIRGLNSNDVGSDVIIFDMQGRLMGKTKISNPSVETYVKPLVPGAYIVKISGARNYTTKLLVN